jgi:hypothetical protein
LSLGHHQKGCNHLKPNQKKTRVKIGEEGN